MAPGTCASQPPTPPTPRYPNPASGPTPRANAAEMLGLSRQSLYVKLRRYGIGDLGPDEES